MDEPVKIPPSLIGTTGDRFAKMIISAAAGWLATQAVSYTYNTLVIDKRG